jgi:hypothetical protein
MDTVQAEKGVEQVSWNKKVTIPQNTLIRGSLSATVHEVEYGEGKIFDEVCI